MTRCDTCGNDSCSYCGQMFKAEPLHVYFWEDICEECVQPLSEEELAEIFWFDKEPLP